MINNSIDILFRLQVCFLDISRGKTG